MDRGIPTEAVLAAMRASDPPAALLYVFAESADRVTKERAMRWRQMKGCGSSCANSLSPASARDIAIMDVPLKGVASSGRAALPGG